ncbi:endonuclease domain-containing protein [Cyanothece sp. BG0011]|uniref:endonuclease domain-containing protein n=1 Tax=Cyanothece sp. BG0011 TaxID=2082950 RepID=UPI000D1E5696|nr:endonuclease domain-containing protein [Cyanothece sp. BG0011]
MTQIYNKSSEKEKRRSLRNNMPPAEQLLWARLRRRQVEGVKFRRQYSIGPFVVDFYVPELRLAIEVDGPSHFTPETKVYDTERQAFIESFGNRFLRFTNRQVYQELDAVVEAIAFTIREMRNQQ